MKLSDQGLGIEQKIKSRAKSIAVLKEQNSRFISQCLLALFWRKKRVCILHFMLVDLAIWTILITHTIDSAEYMFMKFGRSMQKYFMIKGVHLKEKILNQKKVTAWIVSCGAGLKVILEESYGSWNLYYV